MGLSLLRKSKHKSYEQNLKRKKMKTVAKYKLKNDIMKGLRKIDSQIRLSKRIQIVREKIGNRQIV